MTADHTHSHEPMQDFGRQSWKERYRAKQAVWSGRPTQVMVDEVEPLLEPGTVLEFGCGEGTDAVWLAQHGWLVTSVYAHPEQGGTWLVESLARAVAPGGMLLIVGHHPTDPHAADKLDLREAAFTAEEVAEVLDRDVWEVSATVRERTTREAHGGERLWRDAVLVARRD